jgi:hypothetical protein
VLQLRALDIVDVVNFPFMDPPSSQALVSAIELLYNLGLFLRGFFYINFSYACVFVFAQVLSTKTTC